MLVCWRCGYSLEQLSLPLARLDLCPDCGVYLHVCRMCNSFDPAVTKACREDDAEEVRDKQQANFCDYFKPAADAFDKAGAAAGKQAAQKLDALFGSGNLPDVSDADPASAADKLFRKD